MLLGLLCGLLVTEAIFYIRDDGAFPHVNFYVHDTFLGVRLKPHAKARIRFNQNPITRVRINASGYRGPDFPPRSDSEIIVVGDSQVFGLGVEESETFSARLAEYTGRSVINAGVPTYGPIEYSAVATDLIAERKPKTLIYTINFANDLFERDRPNRTRHAIWDGWAVRIETAPDYTIPFPGREWLYQKSHAFYALRRYLHSTPSIGRTGYPSEGTWRDIIDKSQVAKNPNPVFQSRHQTLDQIEGQLTNIEREINREIRDYHPNKEHSDRMLHLAKGSPGDIISELYGEESRDIEVTAKMIAQGMRFREETIQL
ncbi:MAG: hypothetical protein VX278_08355, partial [Myxococcota bacterium]|nr:hypothetical protein [Myxococcota bacterium]